jgi:mannosyltransferase
MRWNRANTAAVLVPALLGLALRLYGLADKPLWLDEIITQKRALLPLGELIANSFDNRHFPIYFIFIRAFDAPIIDEWLLRLPSAIFGSIAILLAALIGVEARSPRAGLAAGLLMALAPFDVQFSQEARPYMLASCLILLALWGLVRIARSSPAAPSGELESWLAYAIGTIGALNVLLVSAPWLAASSLAMLVIVRGSSGTQRKTLIRNWLLTFVIILLAWLPGLIAMILTAGNDPLRGYRWIPPSTLPHVWRVLSAVYLYRGSNIATFALLPTLVPGLGIVIAALALFGAWRLKGETSLLAVIGLALVAMPLAMLAISIFHVVWVPRYLLWSTGPLFVLAGIGAAALPRKLFPIALAAIVVAGVINLTPYYRTETKPRWDLAAAYLAANTEPGDTIVANNTAARYVLSAYADRYHLDRPIIDGTEPASAIARLPATGRVWLVYGRTGQNVQGAAQNYLKNWSSLGLPAATMPLGQQVSAARFDRNTK